MLQIKQDLISFRSSSLTGSRSVALLGTSMALLALVFTLSYKMTFTLSVHGQGTPFLFTTVHTASFQEDSYTSGNLFPRVHMWLTKPESIQSLSWKEQGFRTGTAAAANEAQGASSWLLRGFISFRLRSGHLGWMCLSFCWQTGVDGLVD